MVRISDYYLEREIKLAERYGVYRPFILQALNDLKECRKVLKMIVEKNEGSQEEWYLEAKKVVGE